MINNKKILNIINKLKYQDLIKNLLSVKVYTNIKNNNYSLREFSKINLTILVSIWSYNKTPFF